MHNPESFSGGNSASEETIQNSEQEKNEIRGRNAEKMMLDFLNLKKPAEKMNPNNTLILRFREMD